MSEADMKDLWHMRSVAFDNKVAALQSMSLDEREAQADLELLEAAKVGLEAARVRAANQGRQPDWMDEIESILLREKLLAVGRQVISDPN